MDACIRCQSFLSTSVSLESQTHFELRMVLFVLQMWNVSLTSVTRLKSELLYQTPIGNPNDDDIKNSLQAGSPKSEFCMNFPLPL